MNSDHKKPSKATLICPQCGAESPAEYNFCELDGTPLKQNEQGKSIKPIANCACGAVVEEYDEDGFCLTCGAPWQARNRVERRIDANFAAITDRGLQHHFNEDDVRIINGHINGVHYKILVVCDGLSSAQRSREASTQAAKTTSEFLLKSIRSGATDLTKAMNEAISAAHDAVCLIEYVKNDVKDAPGTTIVACLATANEATIGWVGDSRAYLVSAGSAKLLTHDHSWINQVVDDGILTEAEAAVSMNAHVITHCLGPIETALPGTSLLVSTVSTEIKPTEILVLCSDGLWNYAETLEDFNLALGNEIEKGDALAVAKKLVAHALAKGGRDNITVAVAANETW